MKKKWTNRKLFTYTFKGREPRALLWRKPVYREWFLYAKLAQELGRKIPRAFGNLRKFDDFEDWWKDERYGFELFCEKATGDLVSEVSGKTKLDDDEILLKVNLKGDLEIINRDIRRLLLTKDVADEYTSNARFQPSRPMKHIPVGATNKDEFVVLSGEKVRINEKGEKRDNKLAEYRETYVLAQQMSYKEVAIELGWLSGDKEWYVSRGYEVFEYQKTLDNRVKKVRRHCEQVESIFESIANNTFP